MEDRPEVNKLTKVSLLLGLVTTLLVSITLFSPLSSPTYKACLPLLAIGPIAVVTGVAAMGQINISEGSMRGSKIARAGIALGIVPPLTRNNARW